MSVPVIRRAGMLPTIRALAFGTALLSAPMAFAGKNALYKCVNAAGVISIQSDSCPAGSTQAWRRDATPEPTPTPEQVAQAETKRLRDQQTVRELSEIVENKLQSTTAAPATPASRSSAAAVSEQTEVDACQSAQAFAAAAREKDWLALTEGQMGRLYGWVAEQCKAPVKAD